MDSPLQARTVMPQGYAPTPVTTMPVPPIPTPQSTAYTPNTSLRSPIPTLLTDPDQQRQFYGRGINIKRFWPTSNG